jgi:hypothetical protein
MRPIGRLSIKKPTPRDRPAKGYRSQPRPPYDEPLTPGLRSKELVEAIGFVTDYSDVSEYEDDYDRA